MTITERIFYLIKARGMSQNEEIMKGIILIG